MTLTSAQGPKLTVVETLSQVKPPKVAVFDASEQTISLDPEAPLLRADSAHVLDCGFTSGTYLFLLPAHVSYQQGVLSATLLYEILLGKATLYAVLVSALVLMAMYFGAGTRLTVLGTRLSVLDCGFTRQGVLSAPSLYEILLGKATLYAVLVSALVLMAMVKKGFL
ncbi:Viral T-cell receptor beta chain-like T17T-22 [Camelus dromedarius]|nr:Viral T-cell receptor beta chain-like T17T-22 [Camelus dromedarius]